MGDTGRSFKPLKSENLVAKRLLTLAVLCAFAATGAAAQGTGAAAGPQPTTRADVTRQLDESFARVDANKDGSVDRGEIEAIELKAAQQAQASLQAKLAQEFASLDSDKNGQLSLAEFQAGARIRATPKPDAALQRLDSNKDGKISPAEYRARTLAGFDRVDANKDGTLSVDEQNKAIGR